MTSINHASCAKVGSSLAKGVCRFPAWPAEKPEECRQISLILGERISGLEDEVRHENVLRRSVTQVQASVSRPMKKRT
jgi:hypothetical protein